MADLDAYMLERKDEKKRAVAGIAEAIAVIEAQNREPDQWERVFLAQAISSLFGGIYRLAAIEAALALTPKEKRSPLANLPLDDIFDRCDTTLLRTALREAQLEPVRAFPIFGPAAFTSQR